MKSNEQEVAEVAESLRDLCGLLFSIWRRLAVGSPAFGLVGWGGGGHCDADVMNTATRRSGRGYRALLLGMVLLPGLRLSAAAETRYVSLAGSHAAPYTNWLTAATTIQAAVDASVAGDFIWVTDGVYRVGARVTPGGSLSNRIVITNDITLQSVNGRDFTVIEGVGPLGSNAVRCVYMSAGRLEGFTLTNGFTRTTGDLSRDRSGGGLHATNALVVNCRLAGNSAAYAGGGCRGGAMTDCMISGNAASNFGGGAYLCALAGCVLSGNEALYGGGASDSALSLCVLSNNLVRGAGTGGAAYLGSLSNCTAVGNAAYHGGGAHGSTLYDCTITRNSASNLGGGLLSCTAFNCTLSGNTAGGGGGAREGTLNNCVIHGNSATGDGGGLDNSTALNCTVTDNSAGNAGGGSASCVSLRNCIVYHNRAPLFPNAYQGNSYECCIWPHTLNDFGSLATDPLLLSFSHLASNSPCVAAGTLNTGVRFDVDGEPWGNPPSIGCDEPDPATATGSLAVVVRLETTQVVAGAAVRLVGEVTGVPAAVDWQFGDGQTLVDSAFAAHVWATAGTFQITFTARNATHPTGVLAFASIAVVGEAETATYVSTNSPHPAPPYNDWTNAARTIQEAVDAQHFFGGRVWVSDGNYADGVRVTPGGVSLNRLVVTNPVRIASVNGPSAAFILGQQAADPTNNVRCVFMRAGRLEGFSLVGGDTLAASAQYDLDLCGGGVNAPGGTLSNCVIAGNQCWRDGGGANFGLYYNCLFSGNLARTISGGVDWGVLFDCAIVSNRVGAGGMYGGGMGGGTAYRCRLTGNSAAQVGGAYFAALINCIVENSFNASGVPGAGAGRSHLWNCTIVSNGVGVMMGTWWENTIAYHNNVNFSGSASPFHCCTWPAPPPPGVGNITNAPLFIDAAAGNFRLQYLSPCIDAGMNGLWTVGASDLDDNPRVVGAAADIGAYEQPTDSDGDGLSDPWEQHYAGGLTNLIAGGDFDGDGLPDEDEQRAGTNPLDATSNLRLVAVDPNPAGAGVVVTWAGVEGRAYAVRSSTNAAERVPEIVQTNLAGVSPLNVYTDGVPTDAVRLYGVELQYPP